MALEAWDRITPQGEPTGSYTKILQGPNETYADFLARLQTAISHTVIGEEAKKQQEKLLAYENANQECQKAITTYRPHSPFTKVLLNSITSSIGNFIPHHWEL